MTLTRARIEEELKRLELPDGGDVVSRDMLRALSIEAGEVRFVIEAPTHEAASRMSPLRDAAERMIADLPGVTKVSVALTAHGPAQSGPAASGSAPRPAAGPTIG